MSSSFRINKEVPCNKGCGLLIHFDDKVLSKSGRKIPLEHDGQPHQCPNSDYGKNQQTRTAGAAGIEQWAVIGTMLDGMKKQLDEMESKIDQALAQLRGQDTLEHEHEHESGTSEQSV